MVDQLEPFQSCTNGVVPSPWSPTVATQKFDETHETSSSKVDALGMAAVGIVVHWVAATCAPNPVVAPAVPTEPIRPSAAKVPKRMAAKPRRKDNRITGTPFLGAGD
jgi:hypothetical protein